MLPPAAAGGLMAIPDRDLYDGDDDGGGGGGGGYGADGEGVMSLGGALPAAPRPAKKARGVSSAGGDNALWSNYSNMCPYMVINDH